MKKIIEGFEIGSDVIKLLGLPEETFDINVHIPAEGTVTVSCKYYLSLDPSETEDLGVAIAQYELCEKEPEDVNNESGGEE